MMGNIKFGTDGWRAVISEDFTFDNVKIVAQAIADYIKEGARGQGLPLTEQRAGQAGARAEDKKIVIGYDTRFLSDKYAELVACVMGANGIKVILADRPAPTPSVSFTIKDRKLFGGVMITASHNPARYNGIKYKNQFGSSASTEITKAFESNLGRSDVRFEPLEALVSRKMIKAEDIIPPHLEFLKQYVNIKAIKKSRFKILVDSMHGAGRDYLKVLLYGGKCRVDMIHDEINPGFDGISPEPKMPNLKELAQKTKTGKYSVGLATDGDADRLGVASPNGKVLTGHKVMALLLLHLLEDRKMRGDVVQTICGTHLIYKICKKYGLRMHETDVGFKYISELMIENDVLIGGEETGGVAYKGAIPERDGLLSGLLILEMLSMRKKSLTDILKKIDREYGTFEYRRFDVEIAEEKKPRLMEYLKKTPPSSVLGKKVVDIKTSDGFKFILEDDSWLMLRLSGTEPILRIYAEAPTEKKALDMLDFGKKLAEKV